MSLLSRRALLAAAIACGGATAARADAQPTRLRGTIDSYGGDSITVATRGGEKVNVMLLPEAGVTAVVPAALGDVKEGSFVGTAAVPGPRGALVALELHIFPQAVQGAGAGNHPFDLQPDSTMTNGTIGSVKVSDGHTVTVVTYDGGEQTVILPPDIPIVAFAAADRRLLAVGAHVILFVTKRADGTLVAGRILVGKDGLVPPM
jgi:hypothetical protein